jgi:hypothetical protein
MTEQSFVFDFIRTPNFMDNFNKEFDVDDMDGTTKNFEFVLASSCPDNIDGEGGCLTDGCLNNSVTIVTTEEVALLWSKGVDNDRAISLGGNTSVTIDVGDVNVYMKGLFLRDGTSGYVLAYCILTKTVPITGSVVLPAEGVVWQIRTEV